MAKEVNFGEKDWGEESASGGGRNDFFHMKRDGQYKVRVVGKPHEFGVHWIEHNGNRTKVNCAGKGCVLCAKGLKPSIRYMVPAIFRSGPDVTEGSISITEFGPQVYGHIRALYKTPDWGNPIKYDLIVDKNKSRGASGTYFVTPAKEYPLSDDEQVAVREFLERVNLREFSASMPNELIIEKLGPEVCASLGLESKASTAPTAGNDFDFPEEDGDEYNFGGS